MKLFLEDFSYKEKEKGLKEEEDRENLINQIRELQQKVEYLESSIERERQESFEEGIKRGREEGYALAKEEFENSIRLLEEKKQSEILTEVQNHFSILEENIKNIKEEYKNIIQGMIEILSDSIVEIMEFLYLNSEDYTSVLSEIISLVEEFYEFPEFIVKVGNENLYKALSGRYKVEMDERLKGLDFVVDFRDFKVENKLQEKIRIVKDEIKREIKKLSEV